MVIVNFSGRFGNCVIQYWAAAAFAYRFSLPLNTPWPLRDWVTRSAPSIKWDEENRVVQKLSSHETIEINDGNFVEYMNKHPSEIRECNYHLRGYFQYMGTLEPYIGLLREMFDWKEVEPIGEDSICMHHRGTDHGNGALIVDPSWFVGILEQQSFKHLHIITDDRFATSMFDSFKKWNPEIRCSANAMDDFNWLRQHKKVIIPNSTFSLIAALTGYSGRLGTIFQFARGQCIPYIQQGLTFAHQVDGRFYKEVSH